MASSPSYLFPHTFTRSSIFQEQQLNILHYNREQTRGGTQRLFNVFWRRIIVNLVSHQHFALVYILHKYYPTPFIPKLNPFMNVLKSLGALLSCNVVNVLALCQNVLLNFILRKKNYLFMQIRFSQRNNTALTLFYFYFLVPLCISY